MGTHLTYPGGDARAYPMDIDLNTGATGVTDYAPCVACHDPHGTGTTDKAPSTTNRMMRANWKSVSTLCVQCHQ
jgi:predicted CXXCH cytochrome family protein